MDETPRVDPGAFSLRPGMIPRMPIIVFQHGDAQTPGRLGSTLRDHGHDLDIRRLHRGDPVPVDLDDVRGVVSLGGPQSVNGSNEWQSVELDFLRRAHEAELPVVGVCLGCQLVAKALGGRVERLPEPEYGFEPVSIGVPGQTEPMLGGMPWTFRPLSAHSDHVAEAPPDAVVLASSDKTPVQAFKAGIRTFAFQFHLEADRPITEAICAEEGEALGACGLSAGDIERQADEHYDRSAVVMDRLCVNLAAYCFPYERLLAV